MRTALAVGESGARAGKRFAGEVGADFAVSGDLAGGLSPPHAQSISAAAASKGGAASATAKKIEDGLIMTKVPPFGPITASIGVMFPHSQRQEKRARERAYFISDQVFPTGASSVLLE
jgi:hypothetical protein